MKEFYLLAYVGCIPKYAFCASYMVLYVHLYFLVFSMCTDMHTCMHTLNPSMLYVHLYMYPNDLVYLYTNFCATLCTSMLYAHLYVYPYVLVCSTDPYTPLWSSMLYMYPYMHLLYAPLQAPSCLRMFYVPYAHLYIHPHILICFTWTPNIHLFCAPVHAPLHVPLCSGMLCMHPNVHFCAQTYTHIHVNVYAPV